jgi:hypothetical protein
VGGACGANGGDRNVYVVLVGTELDWSGSGYVQMQSSCEYGNELSDPIKR